VGPLRPQEPGGAVSLSARPIRVRQRVRKGFANRDFEAFVRDQLGAYLVRLDRKDEPVRFGKLARHRQWIEAIFDTLKGQLWEYDPGAERVVHRLFVPADDALRAALARTEEFVRAQLGDVRGMSLDTSASRAPRLAAVP
jgi:hypothetical protein